MATKNSKKYYTEELPEFYATVKRGAMLKFTGWLYSHFGVYVGKYKGIRHCVVHLTTTHTDIMDTVLPCICASLRCDAIAKAGGNSFNCSRKAGGENIGNIQIDDISDLLKDGSYVIIYNDMDTKWQPYESEVVAERTIDRYEHRDEEKPYGHFSTRTQNCESFANGTRYGQQRCLQAENTLTGGVVVAGLLAAGYLILRGNQRHRN